MIFHTVRFHSVADSLCLKSLVWAEYQLHGFDLWSGWTGTATC